ncbi:MAG: pantetheine-phosphate adenylyltransferase [Spirochaetales bacterium]|nr:pantetheine-phosphate adenylyltransferase [Spirochaetales bacterium]
MKKAIYAFSGDPITFGHIDIVKRATRVFDEVTVGIGVNPGKRYTFTLEERTQMARKSLAGIEHVKVVAFKGLLVDYAFEHGIPVIIKGVRNAADFDYEVMLHHLSESQKLDIDTYMLPAKQDLTHVSSSAAKALQQEHGLVHEYVPLHVKMCLEAKMSGQYIIGITGEIGTGKSYVSEKIRELGLIHHIPVFHIELDHIGHRILGDLTEPLYQKVREEIEKKFGSEVRLKDGGINRKVLGEIVFSNREKLEELNTLLYLPLMVRLRHELHGKKGLILFNAALIAEGGMSNLCNNNVVLVTADRESQERRLRERDLTKTQIRKRLQSQFNTDQKTQTIMARIESSRQGVMWRYDNSDSTDPNETRNLFYRIINHVDMYGELRFQSLWERLTQQTNYRQVYDRLLQSYSEKTRAYHTLSHIVRGLEEIVGVMDMLQDSDALSCAWWFHDVIYRPHAATNERESAGYAGNVLRDAGCGEGFIAKVTALIRNTDHTGPAIQDDALKQPDADMIRDIDLSVLGTSWEDFRAYEEKIKSEYSMMSPVEYRDKRTEMLKEMLKRPSIYLSDYFRTRYETRARENIERLLSRGLET